MRLRRAASWLFSHPVRHFVIVWLALLHGGGVYFHVGKLEPDLYGQHAVELRVTPRWRYGYTCGFHGAHLCKTRNVPGAEPSPPVDDEDPPGEDLAADNEGPADEDLAADENDSPDDDLTKAMMAQLDEFPGKACLEAVLFAGIVGYAFWLAPWLWRRLAPPSGRLAWAGCLAALLWMIGWTVALLPLLTSRYGATLYTTYAGPGALVISGPYPGMITGFGGETISYRPLLELVCGFPLEFAVTTGIGRWLPQSTGPFLLVAGLIFWGLFGAVFGLVRSVLVRRAQQAQAHLGLTDQHTPEGSGDEPRKDRL